MHAWLLSDSELIAAEADIERSAGRAKYIDWETYNPQERLALRRFLFFTSLEVGEASVVRPLSSLDQFYNRYFWFMVLMRFRERRHGYDAGFEQQAFQLIANGPDDVDEELIEDIEKMAQLAAKPQD